MRYSRACKKRQNLNTGSPVKSKNGRQQIRYRQTKGSWLKLAKGWVWVTMRAQDPWKWKTWRTELVPSLRHSSAKQVLMSEDWNQGRRSEKNFPSRYWPGEKEQFSTALRAPRGNITQKQEKKKKIKKFYPGGRIAEGWLSNCHTCLILKI